MTMSAPVPPGFWQREASHYPRPLSPIAATTMLTSVNAGMVRLFEDYSFMAETLESREIGGLVYNRLVPLGGKDRRPPPAWLMPVLMPVVIRLVPAMRTRIRGMERMMREDTAGRNITRWYDEWLPNLERRIEALSAEALAPLTDGELAGHLTRAHDLIADGFVIHFVLHGAIGLCVYELSRACERLLGWDDAHMVELLAGLSHRSTEPARALAELARMAAARPEVRALLAEPDDRLGARLAQADPEFASRYDAYLHAYGTRALSYDVADGNIVEQPAFVPGLILDQIARGYDPEAEAAALKGRRERAEGAARSALAGRPGALKRFERALARAARAYPVREDNEFFTVSAPLGLFRRALVETGRRLKERGRIESVEDVCYLPWPEVRAALTDGGDHRASVRARREERARVDVSGAPASYGRDPGPPPSFAALPPAARFTMEGLGWSIDRIFGPPAPAAASPAATVVRGTGASSGQYTGTARVIMSEEEFDKIEPGDVLVCPITSPVWSILFPSVGALVTDTGGTLSHPAIIAREYAIPAVVGTGSATATLRDGQRVTVDGDRGTVTVV